MFRRKGKKTKFRKAVYGGFGEKALKGKKVTKNIKRIII